MRASGKLEAIKDYMGATLKSWKSCQIYWVCLGHTPGNQIGANRW